MSTEVLADQAVSLLRKLITNDLNDQATTAATAVAELVEDGLSETTQDDILGEFFANPTDEEAYDGLATALQLRLDQDGFFRNATARAVDKALRATKTGGPPASTRDANGNLTREPSDTTDTSDSSVATFLWILKAAVAIALVYGAIQAYSGVRDLIAAGGMDEDTKCSTFLVADRATQVEAVRQLVVESGYLNQPYEPIFGGAGAIVACGMSPNKTLGQAIGYPG